MMRTHGSSNANGRVYSVDELFAEHLPRRRLGDGMYGSDMDQTMILNDTGALVFIEYLQGKDFYRFTPEELHASLVPDMATGATTPRAFLDEGAAGHIPGVSAADCRTVLDLRERIVRTYAKLRDPMLSDAPRTPELTLELGAFLRMIVEFDSFLIRLKNQHPCPETSNLLAAAFSRFRLFGGQTPQAMEDAAMSLLAVTEDHPERFLDMVAGDASHAKVDRVVQANAPVYQLLDRAHRLEGAEGVVVTATPADIAAAVIRNSVYGALVPPDRIIATKLARTDAGTHFSGRLDGGMVAGIGKTRLLQQVSDNMGKKVMMVLGDLPGSDGHMGKMALENGGVFVIAHAPGAYEKAHADFGAFMGRIMGDAKLDAAKERIWYTETQAMPLKGAERSARP